MKWIVAAVLLLALSLVFLLPENNLVQVLTPVEQGDTVSETAKEKKPAPVVQAVPAPAAQFTESAEEAVPARPEIQLDQQAIESFRDSVANGDERAPALNRSRQRDEEPSGDELEDPELYQQYERRQQKRMFRAYVEASKIKVAELEKMIEKGKREGVSEEEIEFARNKIDGILQMAEELKRDHPDIMQQDYAPADDWLTNNLGVADPAPETEPSGQQ